MAYEDMRPFGKPEGLGKRLAAWANQLSCDTRLPRVGIGLIDDIREAARQMGVDPDKDYPDALRLLTAHSTRMQEVQEYDL